jgi:hypothetical protein
MHFHIKIRRKVDEMALYWSRNVPLIVYRQQPYKHILTVTRLII